MQPATRDKIEASVRNQPVVLFMKGTRQAPRCGFSARTVAILDSLLQNYEALDVLSDAELRAGIKEYSSWPTIPQLYVNGEFLGGCDIVSEMFVSGELNEKLGLPPPAPPEITVTEAAAAALSETVDAGEHLRLEVSTAFESTLSVGDRMLGDFEVTTGGVSLLVDRLSAIRAHGASIDSVRTADGQAFKVNLPKAPGNNQ